MKKLECFSPKYSLSSSQFNNIQPILGKQFNNGELSICFKGLSNVGFKSPRVVRLNINHIGVSGDFYISSDEMQRILGVNFDDVTQEYIEYIISYYFGRKGVKLKGIIPFDELRESVFVEAVGNFMNNYYSVFFDINHLNVDDDLLYNEKSVTWSQKLKFSIDVKIASVSMKVKDISGLEEDDIIVI